MEGHYRGKPLFPWRRGCALVNMKGAHVEDSAFAELFPPERTLLREDWPTMSTPIYSVAGSGP
jgi:hypothetical protein